MKVQIPESRDMFFPGIMEFDGTRKVEDDIYDENGDVAMSRSKKKKRPAKSPKQPRKSRP